jgi:hypothetical protein
LNVNFPGWRIRRGGPISWPPRSPDLTPLDFFLWGYAKDQVYRKEWISWTNSKQQLQMLQRTCYIALTVDGLCAELQMALNVNCFAPNKFSTCM